jgi:type II secretory pathway pseudopilin PulG
MSGRPVGLLPSIRHSPFAIRHSRRPARGMTLFEVVIAVSIMVLLLAAMFGFLWQFMEGRKQAGLAADQMAIARGVLEGIGEELRGCVGMDQVGFPMEQGQRLIGDRRSITFLTTAVPERGQYDSLGEFDTPRRGTICGKWVIRCGWTKRTRERTASRSSAASSGPRRRR